jgi:hypothetical protein
MTPEGRVKKNINRVLASFPFVYSFMPVQYGMGASGLDYHCVAGKLMQIGLLVELVPIAFFIEAKRPGSGPTNRQRDFAKDRKHSQGAITFVIDEDPSIEQGGGIDKLTEWLEEIEKNNERFRRASFIR